MTDLQTAQQALRDVVTILTATDPILRPSEVWFRVGGAIGTAKIGLIFSGHGIDDAILKVDANEAV